MNYQDYIDFGFQRIDLDDSVEFKQTGYGGFALTVRAVGVRCRLWNTKD